MPDEQGQAAFTEALFEDDPILGPYLGHYVSDRRRLLLQGAVLYIIPVIFLQLIFASSDGLGAALLLIALFGLLGLAVGWYVLHLWNREVVLYTLGFSYREGSNLASFHYSDIISVKVRAERLAYLGFLRTDRYQYTLTSNQDEVLKITNLYQGIQKLGPQLERLIMRARLPIVLKQLAQGQTLQFATLNLSRDGLTQESRYLPWADFKGYRAEASRLKLASHSEADWVALPLQDIDNLLLLVELLKHFGSTPGEQGPAL